MSAIAVRDDSARAYGAMNRALADRVENGDAETED